MHFERLTHREHQMYQRALELYRLSFPPHEQRGPASQANILGDDAYHFDLIYDESAFIGLMLYWETQGFIYVEHFCILPEMRNRAYGQRALELLRQKGTPIILEIDPPVDEVSLRRKAFYERSGFSENPYGHVHPPYHRDNTGHELVVMSTPDRITQAEYDAFKHYLDHHVMQNVF